MSHNEHNKQTKGNKMSKQTLTTVRAKKIIKETEKAILANLIYFKTELFEGKLTKFAYYQEKWIPKSIAIIRDDLIMLPSDFCTKNQIKAYI